MAETQCTCSRCPECGGDGTVWFAFGGKEYLGRRRCDDLDELATCEECRGSGLADGMCDYCCRATEDEDDAIGERR